MSVSLVGLALVLLSFPEHGSLNRVFDNTSGRISGPSLPGQADTEELLLTPPVFTGTVYLGSLYVEEALQRAIELTDAAYTRTKER